MPSKPRSSHSTPPTPQTPPTTPTTAPDPLADPRDPAAATPSERALTQEDAQLQRKGAQEADEPMPLHVYGESEGDHARRHARTWKQPPTNLPKGEEGGTARQPDTSWVKEK